MKKQSYGAVLHAQRTWDIDMECKVLETALDGGVSVDTAMKIINLAEWRPNPSNPRGAGRRRDKYCREDEILKQLWGKVLRDQSVLSRQRISKVCDWMEELGYAGEGGEKMSRSTMRRHLNAILGTLAPQEEKRVAPLGGVLRGSRR